MKKKPVKSVKRRQRKNSGLVALMVRLDAKIVNKLRELSERENLSMSAIVAQTIKSVHTI